MTQRMMRKQHRPSHPSCDEGQWDDPQCGHNGNKTCFILIYYNLKQRYKITLPLYLNYHSCRNLLQHGRTPHVRRRSVLRPSVFCVRYPKRKRRKKQKSSTHRTKTHFDVLSTSRCVLYLIIKIEKENRQSNILIKSFTQ